VVDRRQIKQQPSANSEAWEPAGDGFTSKPLLWQLQFSGQAIEIERFHSRTSMIERSELCSRYFKSPW
jgi:hypothetical protein